MISITNVERLHFSAPERSVNPGGPEAGDEELATSRFPYSHTCGTGTAMCSDPLIPKLHI